MSIIRSESYKDIEKSISKYLEVIYSHTWHVKGETQCYIFGIPETNNVNGFYKIQDMYTRELFAISQPYKLELYGDDEFLSLYFKDRYWKILSLKVEPNYSTALLDLEVSDEYLIRLNGTKGDNPVNFIQQNYFD